MVRHAGGGARDAAVADLGRRGRIAARAISGSSAEQPAMDEGSRRAPEGITREEPGALHPDTISASFVIQDRKSVASGTRVSVRVELGGPRTSKKNTQKCAKPQ